MGELKTLSGLIILCWPIFAPADFQLFTAVLSERMVRGLWLSNDSLMEHKLVGTGNQMTMFSPLMRQGTRGHFLLNTLAAPGATPVGQRCSVEGNLIGIMFPRDQEGKISISRHLKELRPPLTERWQSDQSSSAGLPAQPKPTFAGGNRASTGVPVQVLDFPTIGEGPWGGWRL
jgi:hypothetical protein